MHETDTRHLSDRIFTSERVSRYLPTQQYKLYNTNIGTHTHIQVVLHYTVNRLI